MEEQGVARGEIDREKKDGWKEKRMDGRKDGWMEGGREKIPNKKKGLSLGGRKGRRVSQSEWGIGQKKKVSREGRSGERREREDKE